MSEDNGVAAFRGAMTADAPATDTSGHDTANEAAGQESPSEALARAVDGGGSQPEVRRGDEQAPAWRQAELREKRQREHDERQREQAELAELRSYREQQEKQAKAREQGLAPWDDGWEDNFRSDLTGGWEKTLGERLNPIQAQMRQVAQRMSLFGAVQQHGQKAVDDADKLMQAEIKAGRMPEDQVAKYLSESQDPYGELVAWARQHRMRTEIGDDPEAYKKKLREELLAEINAGESGEDHQAAAPTPSAPRLVTEGPQRAAPKSIPSVNRATGVQNGDEPDNPVDAFRQASRARR